MTNAISREERQEKLWDSGESWKVQMPEQDLLYREEVYQIIGAAIDVHKELGPGFLESVYEECFHIESNRRDIPHQIQVKLLVYYEGPKIEEEFIADYIGYGKIIVELKCLARLTKVEEAQIINYPKATGLSAGLLINFGSKEKLEWRRFVLTEKGRHG